MTSSSHCKTNIFEEEFKFQYVRRDIHIHVATQNIILNFCQSGTLLGNVNMEVLPNIWNRNTFRTTSCMNMESLSSLKVENCTVDHVSLLN